MYWDLRKCSNWDLMYQRSTKMIKILKNIPYNVDFKTSKCLACQENTMTLEFKAQFYHCVHGLSHFLEMSEDVQEIHTTLTDMSQDLWETMPSEITLCHGL